MPWRISSYFPVCLNPCVVFLATMQLLVFLAQGLKLKPFFQRFGRLFWHFCRFPLFLCNFFRHLSLFPNVFQAFTTFLSLTFKFFATLLLSIFFEVFIDFKLFPTCLSLFAVVLSSIFFSKCYKIEWNTQIQSKKWMISYFTCEERCMEPSTLFFLTIWLQETKISGIETFWKWVKFDPRTTGGLKQHSHWKHRWLR